MTDFLWIVVAFMAAFVIRFIVWPAIQWILLMLKTIWIFYGIRKIAKRSKDPEFIKMSDGIIKMAWNSIIKTLKGQ